MGWRGPVTHRQYLAWLFWLDPKRSERNAPWVTKKQIEQWQMEMHRARLLHDLTPQEK